MPKSILKLGIDGGTNEAAPATNYGGQPGIVLRGIAAARRYGFAMFAGLPPRGAAITSATLRVYLRGAWAGGPHTITPRPVQAVWREGTLKWDNQPGVGAVGATVAITGGASGQVVDIDVTAMVAAWSTGLPLYGIRLERDTGGNDLVLHSTEAADPELRPRLIVDWNRPPKAPTDLKPSGGALVSIAKPYLQWAYRDLEGDEQEAFQVQFDVAGGGFGAPTFDSGVVVSQETELDLSTTAHAGLVSGAAAVQWRVRARANGLWSPYSDPALVGRLTKGALTIGSPLAAGVEESTPPIQTTLATRAQKSLQYVLEVDWTNPPYGAAQPWKEVWRKERFPAPTAAGVPYTFTMPAGLLKFTGRNYRLTVDSWDDQERVATPGDLARQTAQVTFQFARSAVPAPVDDVVVAQASGGYAVLVRWHRTLVPDYFALKVGGEYVRDRLVPGDWLDPASGAGWYAITWPRARPGRSKVYEVEAVVLDAGKLKHSQGNDTQAFTNQPIGVWLVRDSAPLERVRFLGEDAAQLAIRKAGATVYAVGRRDGIRITDGVGGYVGSVSGLIDEVVDGSAMVELFEAFQGLVNETFILVAGNLVVPVRLTDATLAPIPNPRGQWAASVAVEQVDDWTFGVVE